MANSTITMPEPDGGPLINYLVAWLEKAKAISEGQTEAELLAVLVQEIIDELAAPNNNNNNDDDDESQSTGAEEN